MSNVQSRPVLSTPSDPSHARRDDVGYLGLSTYGTGTMRICLPHCPYCARGRPSCYLTQTLSPSLTLTLTYTTLSFPLFLTSRSQNESVSEMSPVACTQRHTHLIDRPLGPPQPTFPPAPAHFKVRPAPPTPCDYHVHGHGPDGLASLSGPTPQALPGPPSRAPLCRSNTRASGAPGCRHVEKGKGQVCIQPAMSRDSSHGPESKSASAGGHLNSFSFFSLSFLFGNKGVRLTPRRHHIHSIACCVLRGYGGSTPSDQVRPSQVSLLVPIRCRSGADTPM